MGWLSGGQWSRLCEAHWCCVPGNKLNFVHGGLSKEGLDRTPKAKEDTRRIDNQQPLGWGRVGWGRGWEVQVIVMTVWRMVDMGKLRCGPEKLGRG